MTAVSESVSPRRFLAPWRRSTHFLRLRIFLGLRFLAPFLVTAFVIAWIYGAASDALRPFFFGNYERLLPGVALLIMITIPLGAGILLLHPIGQRVLQAAEDVVIRLPLVGSVFGVSREVANAFDSAGNTGFNRVVQVEYPRKDVWAIGFLTSIVTDENGSELGIVYIPTAPLPSSGFLSIFPTSQIRDVDLSVAETMRMVLSSGVVSPGAMRRTGSVAGNLEPDDA